MGAVEEAGEILDDELEGVDTWKRVWDGGLREEWHEETDDLGDEEEVVCPD